MPVTTSSEPQQEDVRKLRADLKKNIRRDRNPIYPVLLLMLDKGALQFRWDAGPAKPIRCWSGNGDMSQLDLTVRFDNDTQFCVMAMVLQGEAWFTTDLDGQIRFSGPRAPVV